MTKEVYLTANLIPGFLERVKGQELSLMTEAVQRAGGQTKIINLMSMAARPDPMPYAAVNMTGWTCDTHLIYLRELETAGVRLLNPAYQARIADDKMLSYIELGAIVPMAKTIQFSTAWSVNWHKNSSGIEQEIGFPCVVKVTNGARGVGVYKVNCHDDLENLMKLLFQVMPRTENNQSITNLVVQKFIAETAGKCVRVIVVGGQCLGAMLRYSTNSWRTGQPIDNPILGESPAEKREKFPMDAELERMSLAACSALKLNYAAVDFFFGPDGYIVNEVGTSPDTPAFNACNNLSVYDHLADFVINHM